MLAIRYASSDEAAANFPNAVDSADARGPLEIRDFSEELLLGVEPIEKGLGI